ncbi:MAG: DegT/DnrJ/EryC1/StrS family aminotransferase [Gemmatimonadota bacterium]
MSLRRVPPAYAPIRPLGWLRAGGADPRAGLASLLRERLDAQQVLLTGSGTQALRLAVRATLRWRRGGAGRAADATVAVPAFTCFDVASAVLAEAGRIACYDVDPATLAPEPASFGRVLAGAPAVVIVSPLYGVPVDWDRIAGLVRGSGAVLIEDAAQGHGASWKSAPLGALGELSVVSFARGKGWTGGAGGALLVRGEAATALDAGAGLAPAAAGSGMDVVASAVGQWAFGRPGLYGLPARLPWLRLGETDYRDAPTPSAMASAAARLALATAKAADAEAAERRRRGAWLRERLPAGSCVPIPDGGRGGELRLPVRIPGGAAALGPEGEALGAAQTFPAIIPALPAVAGRLDPGEGRWPGSEMLLRELVTLPTHSLLRRNDAERLLRMVDKVASSVGGGDSDGRRKTGRLSRHDGCPPGEG